MIKEDDIVLCTVKKIEGATVFLDIENDGEGSMVMSEVAAGRIRNLREYVFPNKKIVCKILKILPGNIQLSLRRVTGKERESVLERNKKEKTIKSMLKTALKNPEKTIEKIKTKYELWQFIDEVKANPKILGEFMSQEEAQIFQKIIAEKKEKEKTAKRIIIIKSNSESGLYDIKSVLETKEADIRYLGSSKFMVSVTGKDFKDLNINLNKTIAEIEDKAKKKKLFLEIKEK